VVLLSITPLLDGVLRLDIIAPFHTSGPPLLQFHLAIEQWGVWNCSLGRTSVTVTLPIAFENMCTVALATPTGAPWDGVGTYAITSRTTSQITIYGDYSQVSTGSDALVIALGF